MITNIDLERICNYEDNPKATLPVMTSYYIDFVMEDEEAFKLELKKHNRDLAIDAILDDKIDEYVENKDKLSKDDFQMPFDSNKISSSSSTSFGFGPTISAKVVSQNLTSNKLKDLDTLYNDVIKHLDTITNKPLNTLITCQNLDLKLVDDPNLSDYENNLAKHRKIITRILGCSNLVAMNGRTGPGKTILIGNDFYEYFLSSSAFYTTCPTSNGTLGNIAGLDVIHSHIINPKKAIILRGSNKADKRGLNVITNVNNGNYYMDKTNEWETTMAWFELI